MRRYPGRALVVQRQLDVHDVGKDVAADRRPAANRLGLEVRADLEEIVAGVEALGELVRVVEDEPMALIDVHHRRRVVRRQQQRWAASRVDESMPGIDGRQKQRARLPLEHVLLRAALVPHLGAAAAFDDQEELVVHVLLGVQGAAGRHLDHEHAFDAFEAVQIQERPPPAQALPVAERQVARVAHPDATVDRDAFLFHEALVRAV